MTDPPAPGRRRVIDLSHVTVDGMLTYPGIPVPVPGSHLTFDESDLLRALDGVGLAGRAVLIDTGHLAVLG